MKRLTSALLVALALGCQGQPRVVKIGVLLPTSGSGEDAAYAREVLNGIYLAIDDMGQYVKKSKIELVEKDIGANPQALEQTYKELEEAGVIAVIGPLTSNQAVRIKSLADQYELPTFLPAATYNSLTEGSQYVWRISATNRHMAMGLSKFAIEDLNVWEVGIMDEAGNSYSEEMTQNFTDYSRKLDMDVVKLVSFKKGDEFDPLLSDIVDKFTLAAESTALYAPVLYQDAASVIVSSREAGFKGVILGADGWDSPRLLDLTGSGVGTCYFVTHFSPEDPDAKDFVESYRARFNAVPGAFAALGYDALATVRQAIQQSQEVNRQGIKEQMQFVSVVGVTGKIEYDRGYDPKSKIVYVIKVTDDGFSYVKKFQMSPYGGS